MFVEVVEAAPRALRVSPVGAMDLAPPRCIGDASGVREVVGQQAGEDERPAITLRIRDVAGGRHEARKPAVADGVGVDREARHGLVVHG